MVYVTDVEVRDLLVHRWRRWWWQARGRGGPDSGGGGGAAGGPTGFFGPIDWSCPM